MAHRFIALVLLLVFAGASHTVALCAGWAASASERMSCCQRQDSTCASLSADDCCAAGEQRQNVERLVLQLPAGDATLSRVGTLMGIARHAVTADPRSLAERPATHLLDSVFRI